MGVLTSNPKRLPVAVLDACVLVPMPLADTLLRLAEPPAIFVPRWSDEILEEVTRTLVSRFGKSPEKARNREAAMRRYFPDAPVRGYDRLVSKLSNDPKDRHVLAAAIASKADFLVTYNLRHFPAVSRGVEVIGPSTFLKRLLEQHPEIVRERLAEQAATLQEPMTHLLDRLAAAVPGFVHALRQSNPAVAVDSGQ